MLSVVIPTFNRSKYISAALDSVFNQSYRPIEVIVVDDGSEDNTEQVVADWYKQYQNDDFKLIFLTQKNQGANNARNRGIKEATNNYIAFLDSDDRWLPNKLKNQFNLVTQDPEIGAVYCGQQTVNLITGATLPVNKKSYPRGEILKQLLVHDVTEPTSCWLIKKQCFEVVGLFDENLPARQDWDMWIRLSTHYCIESDPTPLVLMGDHPDQRIRTDGTREIKAYKGIFKKYHYLRTRYSYKLSLAARSAMYRRLGRVYFHNRSSPIKAIGFQIMAILVWPFNFDSYAALIGILMPRQLRGRLHIIWNNIFGKTCFAIRSH